MSKNNNNKQGQVIKEVVTPVVDEVKAPVPEEKKTEKTIESEILHWINSQKDCFAFKVNTVGVWDEQAQCYRNTGLFTLKGTSDILGIWKGKPLAIEVKNAHGQLSTEQHAFLNKYRSLGGLALKAESLEVAQRNLNYYDKYGTMIV